VAYTYGRLSSVPNRDIERFERIVMPHLDDAYTLARYLVGDEHDAQDVVQDASLRALRYFESYSGGDGRAWLLAIVRNCSMDWRRRQHGERHDVSIDGDAAIDVADETESDARAIQSSESGLIMRAVAALPTEFREVIVLRELEDLSYKEISEVVGAPIGTVMSRIARARKQLALALGPSVKEAG
jgi:RNA polymerase sigma-70 factor (ECF subfamily)